MADEIYFNNKDAKIIRHSALVLFKNTAEKFEEIFSIEANGDIVLRGKVIATDKEVADTIIEATRKNK